MSDFQHGDLVRLKGDRAVTGTVDETWQETDGKWMGFVVWDDTTCGTDLDLSLIERIPPEKTTRAK